MTATSIIEFSIQDAPSELLDLYRKHFVTKSSKLCDHYRDAIEGDSIEPFKALAEKMLSAPEFVNDSSKDEKEYKKEGTQIAQRKKLIFTMLMALLMRKE